jgi:hypothetical protein
MPECKSLRLRDYRLGTFCLTILEGKSVEFYNLHDDPGENINIAMEETSTTRKFVEDLIRWEQEMARLVKDFQSGGQADLSPKDLERLRSLGYIR